MGGAIPFLRRAYHLDTLDTRFTNSSSVPYQTVIDARSDPVSTEESANKARARSQPSKWNTPEFYFYYLIFILAVPYMFWVPYEVSRRMSLVFLYPFVFISNAHWLAQIWQLLTMNSFRPTIPQVQEIPLRWMGSRTKD